MKGSPFSREFDKWFEEMSELAKKDPEEFEKRRKELIEEVIQQANPIHQKKLRQLQWRIDMERKRCKTPLASCIKLHEMLWNLLVNAENSFLEAVESLKTIVFALKKLSLKSEEFRSSTEGKSSTSVEPDRVSKAKIIPFPKNRRR